jgi:hypothetical protein
VSLPYLSFLPTHGKTYILAIVYQLLTLSGELSASHQGRCFMAQCAYCKAETQLYFADVPVCIQCADERSPEQTRARLLQNVADATMRAEAASEAFQKVVEETSGVPRADAPQRIKNVSRQLSKARDEMMEAHRLLDDYVKDDV